jgi:hypothetical protein
MTEHEFQSEMRRAQTMGRVTGNPHDPEYWQGYARGLRRAYHGERFGSQAEHELWLTLADDEDESRAARGRGYRDGMQFKH